MINTTNINQARKEILNAKPPITIKAQSLEFNRKILEYGKFQILVGLEKPLNHVMARIATKNNIEIALDLNTLCKTKDKKQKAQAMEQIIQNIKTLRKAKTKITLLNAKDKTNAKNLLLSLKASTQQAKQSVQSL